MTKSVSFKPQTDIPSLAGRVILVTGANAGLGKAAALELARHGPAQVWLACRDAAKGRAAAAEIASDPDVVANNLRPEIQPLVLDLASLASVQRAAREFCAAASRLDILMCNAGIMATAPGVTEDGYEAQLGTNHMGHALLLRLLLPVLESTAALPGADVRVVVLSSDAHAQWPKGGPKRKLDLARGTPAAAQLGTLNCYFRSKLANALWARRLARDHPRFTVVAIHPGVVATSLMQRSTGIPRVLRGATRLAGIMGILPNATDGARNQLWAAVGDKSGGRLRSGEYYEPVGVAGGASDDARDDGLADALWEWTQNELDIFLSV
ncbi:hypothetical protein B0T14DRAFT_481902 [Immersiella caudata]|uniref:Uncharacterized protein n=1 Tax=Immersiella caudata TaxID=314043 RepID=A0AA39WSK1_9PEZI|nr:hypothetical protein B0T14DRAFT_481902 [Immersiella caudata]